MKHSGLTVDEYINQFTGEARDRLMRLRKIINSIAPDAEEGVMYGLVGYKLHGKPLAYFGGFAHHTGFYATPNGHEAFKQELSAYKQGKGSVQFPLDRPLPEELVRRMVRYRQRLIAAEQSKE